MIEYVSKLSIPEAEELKRVIKDLMRQSCILETKYDPGSGSLKDNPRYHVCMRHREFLTDYFEVMGCQLIFDPQDHFFRLMGEGAAQERFGESATRILLLMKLIYREKILGQGLNATTVTLSEIRHRGMETGILTRKLTDREVYDAMNLMKTHQMIELPCAISDLEDDTRIYMYQMINVYCSSSILAQLYEKYKETGGTERGDAQ